MMKRNNDGNEKNCHHNLEDSLDYSFVIHHKDEIKSQIEFKRYICWRIHSVNFAGNILR